MEQSLVALKLPIRANAPTAAVAKGSLPWVSAALLFAVVSLAGCEAEPSPKEKRETAISKVGFEASLTAAFIVKADRACQIVGRSFNTCAGLKGALLDEQFAQSAFKVATQQALKYYENCVATFGQQYCEELLERAISIEARKSRK